MTRCPTDLDAVPTPPYSADFLGDLHAGVMDSSVEAQLWPRVRADGDAMRFIESLDAVTGALGRRGRDLDTDLPMPGWVRNRLESTLFEQQQMSHRTWWSGRHSAMVLLAAAAVIGIAAAGVAGLMSGGVIGPADDDVAVTADGDTSGAIDTTLITESIGSPPSGVFADPARLASCLAANGIAGDARVLGMSEITLRGRGATLIVVPGPEAPSLTAIAVGDRCGEGAADTVSRVELG